MRRTLVSLGCALAFAGSALAQQPSTSPSPSDNASGGSLTERARQAAQDLGEKGKQAAETARDKAQETAGKAKAGMQQATQSGQSGQPAQGTQSMGASGSAAGGKDPQQMQKQADADYKSAKAQCEPIAQQAQKTLCEKQATAAHAAAEVEVEKAKMAAQGGGTSAMGAGKPAQ